MEGMTIKAKKGEAAGFCLVALAVVSSGLFLLRGPEQIEEPPGESSPCLPGFSVAAFNRAEAGQEELTVALPKEPALSSARNQGLPSRGERVENNKIIIQGTASWYGGADGLDGRLTASGERFDASAFTAAHRTLPFDTRVRVTFLRTGKSVVVRINDRGPFSAGRIIDLSRGAAAEIGLLPYGVGRVELEILD